MRAHLQASWLRVAVALGAPCCGHAPSLANSQAAERGAEITGRTCYGGTQTLAGHFETPRETDAFAMTLELYAVASNVSQAYVVSTWSPDAPESVEQEHVWIDGERVIRETADSPAVVATRWEATWARELARLGAPSTGTTAYEQRVPHPTFGDVVERIQPGGMTLLDGLSAPKTLSLAHAAEAVWWTAELRRKRCPRDAEPGNPPDASPQVLMDEITWRTLEPGVELALLHGSNMVSLVVELSKSLVVCETGLTVQQGEQLIDALAERFPNKPVAHVLFGHHHPHYTGGLRAFIAAGALVHAPAQNARFAQHLADLPFTLAPDRLAKNPKAARIEPFEGELALFDDGRLAVQAIDIGRQSNHTQEYVLTYLPRSKLLFEGDVGWFLGPTGQIRPSRRAAGMLRAVTARGLTVDHLVQSWPLMGSSQVIEHSALRAAVSGH